MRTVTTLSSLRLKTIFFVLLAACLVVCSKYREKKNEAVVLARVGEKTITLEEFLQRAEYTIRPRYCKGNSGVEKKTVLNSLLAEKMLALEAGKDNLLAKSEHFQRFVQGRKEQAMRQVLAYEEGLKKVQVDTGEIKNAFKLAGRKYNVEFIALNCDSLAAIAERMLASAADSSFEKTFHTFSDLDSIPRHEVEWSTPEDPRIHQALFSGPLRVGQVIGPLQLEKDNHIIMRVKGWTDRVAITDTDVRQRWEDVSTRLKEQKAEAVYSKFIGEVMRGKRMEFNPDTFIKLVNIIGPIYFPPKNAKEDAFLDAAFSRTQEIALPDTLDKTLEALGENPLFELDGKVWTVKDFLQEYERHPLVFRKKKMGKSEFAEQLKLAIVDMVRDRYLTEEAYKRGYDSREAVKRNVEMWEDANLALFQKAQYLSKRKADEKDAMKNITQYLDPYADSLQAKYSDQIEVNIEAFNDAQLTRIDMFTIQENVPFPVYVPAFPQVTTDSKLDYGQKMPEKRKRIKL